MNQDNPIIPIEVRTVNLSRSDIDDVNVRVDWIDGNSVGAIQWSAIDKRSQ